MLDKERDDEIREEERKYREDEKKYREQEMERSDKILSTLERQVDSINTLNGILRMLAEKC